MPLKSPRPTGLKKLKKIIGHKGEAFARLIGVPYDTLKSIESGRLKMSKDVAHKIKMATGVRIESLYEKTPRSGDLVGGAYTENHFYIWRSYILSLGEDKTEANARAEKLAQYIGFFTKVLLLAAVEEGEKVTYRSLHLEIASVLRDLAEKHQMGPKINRVLERFGWEEEWELTKREWRAHLPLKEECKVTNRDLRRLGDYDKHKARRMLYPKWHPEGVVDERALLSKS
jgi:DNA-binding XRE family transcriptional regulator